MGGVQVYWENTCVRNLRKRIGCGFVFENSLPNARNFWRQYLLLKPVVVRIQGETCNFEVQNEKITLPRIKWASVYCCSPGDH
jgi:hypothetical protein